MSIVSNITYTGEGENARDYAIEMMSSGLVQKVREEPGCLRYDFYFPMEDKNSVLLINEFTDEAAIKAHHDTPMLRQIAALRKEFNLTMNVERLTPLHDWQGKARECAVPQDFKKEEN